MQIKFFKPRTDVLSDSEARRLTSDFLDGRTDIAEERRLYDYYNGRRIAHDLRQYCDMFRMYASMDASRDDYSKQRRRYMSVAAAISALLVVGIALTVGLNLSRTSDDHLYAGYVITNGKKISDYRAAKAEMQRNVVFVDSIMAVNNPVQADNLEREIIEDMALQIDDPEARELFLANI